MDINKIIKRVIGIITTPKKEWAIIKNEETSVIDLLTKYAIFLAAIPAIASFFGFLIAFRGRVFGRIFFFAIVLYIFQLAGAFALGLIIDALAPAFSASKNQIRSFKIAVYSYTASWAFGILILIPRLRYISMVVGLYSLYLLYLGMEELTDTPKDKLIGYFITSVVALILIMLFIDLIVRSIAFGSARAFLF